MDELGLILRRDIIWSKPNGLPESVTDRCRSSHEYLFHFTVRPRYYAAVDEIREPHTGTAHGGGIDYGNASGNGVRHRTFLPRPGEFNALGKLPGSVWEIPSQPLSVPARLGVDHFAAFPMELPRRCILGWSPPGICTECGEGRRSVAAGYACACTPYTYHPGTADNGKPYHQELAEGRYALNTGGAPRDTSHPGHAGLWDRPKTGPWREYHLDRWTPPPTRPAVVVDPFGGTGTTALVASMLGRTGVSVDLSADYCRLARWRTTDPAERARALQVPKPPPVPDGQASLFDEAS
jgi:hypothetical protein